MTQGVAFGMQGEGLRSAFGIQRASGVDLMRQRRLRIALLIGAQSEHRLRQQPMRQNRGRDDADRDQGP